MWLPCHTNPSFLSLYGYYATTLVVKPNKIIVGASWTDESFNKFVFVYMCLPSANLYFVYMNIFLRRN